MHLIVKKTIQKEYIMKKNMGTVDKAVRILVAAVIIVLYALGILSGTIGLILGIIALVFIFTSFIGFCPLYTLLGLNTCKTDNKK
jgi:predicted PurR-regulated permease PerM